MGALASRANISTAATEPQSGHLQKEITIDGTTHLLNMRVEVIPTMYGQDAVIRLFNYDESMLSLDRLGIGPDERKEIDEIISHPRGMVLMVGPTELLKGIPRRPLQNSNRRLLLCQEPSKETLFSRTFLAFLHQAFELPFQDRD